MKRLENKIAIVTGGADGIGKAIIKRFISEGASVVIADINIQAAERLSANSGGKALSFKVDVSNSAEMLQLISFTEAQLGRLDIMVNNAGIGSAGTIDTVEEDEWDKLININLKGTFFGMKYALPALKRSGGGAIINISSIAAVVGLPERPVYSATKGGILAMTRSSAIDHIKENIRINCIAPGTTDTPWIERITNSRTDPEAARKAMYARQPHGRLVKPEEIAAMAAYLASDESASVVGACMIVDGGMTAA